MSLTRGLGSCICFCEESSSFHGLYSCIYVPPNNPLKDKREFLPFQVSNRLPKQAPSAIFWFQNWCQVEGLCKWSPHRSWQSIQPSLGWTSTFRSPSVGATTTKPWLDICGDVKAQEILMGPDPQVFFGYWKCFLRYFKQVWKRILICPKKRSWRILEVFEVCQKRVVRPNQKEEVLNMEADVVQDGETYYKRALYFLKMMSPGNHPLVLWYTTGLMKIEMRCSFFFQRKKKQ